MSEDIYPDEIATNQWSKGIPRIFWGENLPIRFYGDVRERPMALELFVKAFGAIPNEEILDAGSGEGYLSYPLAKKGFKVVGVEQSRGMLDQSKLHMPNTRFLHGDIDSLSDLNIKTNSLAGCICVGVLLHVNPERLFKTLKSIVSSLKSGSPILLSVPHEYLADVSAPTTNNQSGVVNFELIQTHKTKLSDSKPHLSYETAETYFHSLEFEPLQVKCFIHSHEFILEILRNLNCNILQTTELYFQPDDSKISPNWDIKTINHPFYFQIIASKL